MKKRERRIDPAVIFDIGLIIVLAAALLLSVFRPFDRKISEGILILAALAGLLPVLVSAGKALVNRRLTIDLLASVALVAALFSREWASAVFISLMIASARLFERITEGRTKKIVEALFKFRPEKVKVKKGDEVVEIPFERLVKGDLVVIESGDRLPVDGSVVSGRASINQATLTGESEPVAKKTGDRVLSGTLNESGSLLVEAERVGTETTLSKMIMLVTAASQEKIPAKRLADKFAAWYILVTFAFALIYYFGWGDLNFILAVLLVVCADDVAVAVPLSFSVGIARAARRGILVKNAGAMETLPKIKSFIADKTGTLTRGEPRISGLAVFDGFTRKDILRLIAMVELNSNHPAGRAMVAFAKKEGIKPTAPEEFLEFPGEGIFASWRGQKIWAGKEAFLKEKGIRFFREAEKRMTEAIEQGRSVTVVGVSGRIAGFLVLEDEIKPSAVLAVVATRELGVDFWAMLTGDNERVAVRVAEELGLDEWRANLRPEEKVEMVRRFRKERGRIVMIGDGVNDAAALAMADVSIAMGAIGSDAAIEAADIALMRDDLRGLPEAILISQGTMKTVAESFWIWGITNAIGLGLVFAGFIGPLGAAAYNFLTDFIPIVNVFRRRPINISLSTGRIK